MLSVIEMFCFTERESTVANAVNKHRVAGGNEGSAGLVPNF